MKRAFLALTLLAPSLLLSSQALSEENFSDVYKAYQQAFADENYAEAVKLAKQAEELGAKKFEPDSENQLNLRFNLAIAQIKNRQFENAYKLLDDLADDFEDKYGDESFELLHVYIQHLQAASKIYSRRGVYGKKYKSLGYSILELAEDIAEASPEGAATAYNLAVEAFSVSGSTPVSFRKIVQFTELAQEYAIRDFGQLDSRTAGIQFYLAKLYKAQKKLDKSIEQFEQLVGSLDEGLTFTHPYELGSHAQLVELYERKGKSDKATEHCIAIGKMTPWVDDLEPIPLYRKDARYPLNYASAGREGWVRMEFDITPMGFVENIRVIESEGGEGFESKSIDALSAWRYAPKFENGVAVTAKDRRVQLDFRLSP